MCQRKKTDWTTVCVCRSLLWQLDSGRSLWTANDVLARRKLRLRMLRRLLAQCRSQNVHFRLVFSCDEQWPSVCLSATCFDHSTRFCAIPLLNIFIDQFSITDIDVAQMPLSHLSRSQITYKKLCIEVEHFLKRKIYATSYRLQRRLIVWLDTVLL